MALNFDDGMGWWLIIAGLLWVAGRIRQFFKRREDRWLAAHSGNKPEGNTDPAYRPMSEEEMKREREMYEVWKSLREEDKRKGPGPPAQ